MLYSRISTVGQDKPMVKGCHLSAATTLNWAWKTALSSTNNSLTTRQRCLAGNANALPFLWNKSPHVPIPNLES
ncbi:hypothetical protein CSKR_101536 [Clonorchis sinensis]|uniref:Uncharacterized protein n=1 Tax=Clonorchis sinensis TaxID=79923 RepID=A0A419PSC2_CLOSI|nr:hypothetical protein CSKR_101536 [Clonorchis sinensis]